eukprot:TRINITY_DN40816_c0_g1_i1.p1 TRINITY_DN40816_c0_g1~~TRINITY_DN40816_c0_g1_i1.p1  ORF type:complete len:365 (+),score=85.76 TRINITY_DN40816_c0_g1_i1:14-1108(+)
MTLTRLPCIAAVCLLAAGASQPKSPAASPRGKKLLNDGTEMPFVGLGVWRSAPEEVEQAVFHAICHSGYRHIDAAQIYQNHNEVGKGLKRAFETAACAVSREDVWVTSKIWNVDFHPKDVSAAVDRILDELGLAHVDQVLLHWPTPYKKPPLGCPPECPEEFGGTDNAQRPRGPDGKLVNSEVPLAETWQALEEVKATGKVRSIGVSNFNVSEIKSLLVKPDSSLPAVNQVEAHAFWQQEELRKSLAELGIAMVAYSPLGNPGLYGSKLDGMAGSLVGGIASETGMTPAQVMLNFLLAHDVVVIPKSVTPARIDSNIDFIPKLTEDHISKIIHEAPQQRLANPKNRPGGLPVFMDEPRKARSEL